MTTRLGIDNPTALVVLHIYFDTFADLHIAVLSTGK